MTGQLAAADPAVREFEARVVDVDGRSVRLEETYFYAESGGQPADRGTLGGVLVEDVRATDSGVVHELSSDPPFDEGDAVVGVVDDAFRTYCMRAHTASHALYGAGRLLFEELGYGGFDIGTEKVRVDFDTPSDVDDEALVELERLVNRAVWDARPVTWEEVPVEEARAREEVAFNTKTEEGVFADSDAVRVVTVGGAGGEDGDGSPWDSAEPSSAGPTASPWDVAACGGTHVSNTSEIGPVAVLDRSNPGEGLTRVEFAVGPAAVRRFAAVHRAALDAARTVGTGVSDLPAEVARLGDEREELRAERDELRSELLAARLAELETVERDGLTWRVGAVEGVGPNDLGDPLREIVADGSDVAAVVGRADPPFVVVASAGDVAAGDVVTDVTDAFGGGGGGGASFAQGGGLDADPEELLAHLRGRENA